jgi:hypothetical protein
MIPDGLPQIPIVADRKEVKPQPDNCGFALCQNGDVRRLAPHCRSRQNIGDFFAAFAHSGDFPRECEAEAITSSVVATIDTRAGSPPRPCIIGGVIACASRTRHPEVEVSRRAASAMAPDFR